MPHRRQLLGAAGLLGLAGCSPWRAAPPGPARGAAMTPAPTTAASTSADGLAPSDLAHAAALRDRALNDGTAWRLLQQLCGDIGARPAGSAADERAQAWGEAALRGLGLEAVRREGFSVRAWQRGPAAARLTAPAERPLVMAALGNSVATPAAGLEAEVAWYPDLAALRADPADRERSRANGRIVFIDQRTERTRDGRGYGSAVGARINGPVEAARRGAVALAIRSIGTSGASNSNSGSSGTGSSSSAAAASAAAPVAEAPTGRAAMPVAHTGATRYDLNVPRIPAFAVSVADADYLASQHAAGHTLRLQVQLQARSDVEAPSANIVAEWPGTDLAHEIVLIGAHLDSWDVGQGAEDNGAGVAIVSAAAGLIAAAGRRARRTIRVVLFGNEENGFDGALDYARRHGAVPHQLVAESDFGAGRIYGFDSRVAPDALPLVARIAELLAPLGVARPATDGNRASPGPDAALLMRRQRWPALALAQDGSRYFDVHHTASDTLERLDASALPQNVAAWAAMTWLAAQSPLPFGPPVL